MEEKQRFIELRAQGWSYDRIAQELGRAKQTLVDWGREFKEEIANLKALELDKLYQEYYLTKESRLQTFGQMLTRIKDELLNRDLSEVPTDKLLELFLKYNSQVKEEIIEPQFKTSAEIEEEKLDREILEELTSLQPKRKLKVV